MGHKRRRVQDTTSMADMSEGDEILKTDALGRVRMPVEKREVILDKFEASGMSGQAFAEYIGVKYQTFATWVQKRRKARGEYPLVKGGKAKAPLALIKAVVEPESASAVGAVEVETASGLKVRVRSQGEIALEVELIRTLERSAGPMLSFSGSLRLQQ